MVLKTIKKHALVICAAIALVVGILALLLPKRRASTRQLASKRIFDFQLKKREIEATTKIEILQARKNAEVERKELENALSEPNAERRLKKLSDLMKDY